MTKYSFWIGLSIAVFIGIIISSVSKSPLSIESLDVPVLNATSFFLAYLTFIKSPQNMKYPLSVIIPCFIVGLLVAFGYGPWCDFLFKRGNLSYSDGPMFGEFVMVLMTLVSLPGIITGIVTARFTDNVAV